MKTSVGLFLIALVAKAAEAQRRRIVLPSRTLHSNTFSSQQRALQDIEQVCNDDGTVNAAGTITPLISPEYQPICTCSEVNNFDSLSSFDPSQGFEIDRFNQLISDLQIDIDWKCDNQCSMCFPLGDCALVDVAFITAFEGIDASFSLADLLSLDPNGGASQFLRGEQSTEICTEFTSGQTGKACLKDTVGVDFLDNSNVERPCSLTYNGLDCLSCTIDAAGCLIADCSNHGVSSVNTCAKTGVDTIFQILPFYTGAAIGGGLTLGCGVQSATSPTIAPVAAAMPTAAPAPVESSTTAPLTPFTEPTMEPDPLLTPAPVVGSTTSKVKIARKKGSDEAESGPVTAPSPLSPDSQSFSSESTPKQRNKKETGTLKGSSKKQESGPTEPAEGTKKKGKKA